MYSIGMFKQMMRSLFASESKSKDVFENIYGLESIKELLKSTLHASAPVHVLLAGPPSTGKTEIAKCVSKYYETIWIEGTYATISGLVQQLKEKPQAKVLVVNELEKARVDVRVGLLEILENQKISKTTKTETFTLDHNIWMIATCNNFAKLEREQPELVSRLIVKQLQKYTPEQFLKVAVFRVMREGVTSEVAEYIAESVLKKFGTEVRKAVAIARMSKTVEDVNRNIELI